MEFLGGPRSRRGLGWWSPSAADVTGDVAADELSSIGIFERRSHDHVDFGDRLWCETGPFATTGVCQPFVEFVEVIGCSRRSGMSPTAGLT